MTDEMPDDVFVSKSRTCYRKFYAHDYVPQHKNSIKYRRADAPKEVDVGVLKDKSNTHESFYWRQGWKNCLDHLVALGVIKDKGV